ncbi:flagellar hook-length control protein FliK [Zymomonas mobilis subsp. mobilis]|nr:flagellar hook-length control protein FliK [Zymomonas mobilis subsp. mobilis]
MLPSAGSSSASSASPASSAQKADKANPFDDMLNSVQTVSVPDTKKIVTDKKTTVSNLIAATAPSNTDKGSSTASSIKRVETDTPSNSMTSSVSKQNFVSASSKGNTKKIVDAQPTLPEVSGKDDLDNGEAIPLASSSNDEIKDSDSLPSVKKLSQNSADLLAFVGVYVDQENVDSTSNWLSGQESYSQSPEIIPQENMGEKTTPLSVGLYSLRDNDVASSDDVEVSDSHSNKHELSDNDDQLQSADNVVANASIGLTATLAAAPVLASAVQATITGQNRVDSEDASLPQPVKSLKVPSSSLASDGSAYLTSVSNTELSATTSVGLKPKATLTDDDSKLALTNFSSELMSTGVKDSAGITHTTEDKPALALKADASPSVLANLTSVLTDKANDSSKNQSSDRDNQPVSVAGNVMMSGKLDALALSRSDISNTPITTELKDSATSVLEAVDRQQPSLMASDSVTPAATIKTTAPSSIPSSDNVMTSGRLDALTLSRSDISNTSITTELKDKEPSVIEAVDQQQPSMIASDSVTPAATIKTTAPSSIPPSNTVQNTMAVSESLTKENDSHSNKVNSTQTVERSSKLAEGNLQTLNQTMDRSAGFSNQSGNANSIFAGDNTQNTAYTPVSKRQFTEIYQPNNSTSSVLTDQVNETQPRLKKDVEIENLHSEDSVTGSEKNNFSNVMALAANIVSSNNAVNQDSNTITLGNVMPSQDQVSINNQLDLAHQGLWLDQLTRDIATASGSNSNLTFNLHPDHLGMLHVSIQSAGDGVAVHMTASSEAAQSIIAGARHDLMNEAHAQGVHITDARIDLNSQTMSQQSGQNGQPSHQQMADQQRSAVTAPITNNTRNEQPDDDLAEEQKNRARYA